MKVNDIGTLQSGYCTIVDLWIYVFFFFFFVIVHLFGLCVCDFFFLLDIYLLPI